MLRLAPDARSSAGYKMNSSSSTMNEEPDALSVVNQLRDLAADPLNRRAIVQDQGCLPGLILFMDHPNPPVVHSALLALRYLAECRANREKMKGELGMMLSLQNVIQNDVMEHWPCDVICCDVMGHWPCDVICCDVMEHWPCDVICCDVMEHCSCDIICRDAVEHCSFDFHQF
ncbi:hypothetical protein U0070_014841 [Myodes glareolus]|uniref:Armadillo repeat-containing protein 1 n=1 Tax=Myodes glareolus TaxID=447135 RepID=A0AAW0JE74_MYOGA